MQTNQKIGIAFFSLLFASAQLLAQAPAHELPSAPTAQPL